MRAGEDREALVGLTFEEDGDEIRTVGLGEIGQTEFMTKVSAWTDVEDVTCDNKLLVLRRAGNYVGFSIGTTEPRA